MYTLISTTLLWIMLNFPDTPEGLALLPFFLLTQTQKVMKNI
jgi:hypothetical protein